jgi:hypothetical protein
MVTVVPTGPLVGLMLVIVGGALGFTVGEGVGVGPADALDVGVADAAGDAVGVGVGDAVAAGDPLGAGVGEAVAAADGRTVGVGVTVELPPEQATILASKTADANNRNRPRANMCTPGRRRCISRRRPPLKARTRR